MQTRQELEYHWTILRTKEMEEKAGVQQTAEDYPDFDMDGLPFHPEEDFEEEQRKYDAYMYSCSRRLLSFEEKIAYLWM